MNSLSTLKTSFSLKMIATILMIIDHLGLILGNNTFHYLGRFSFPLFAYLIVQGFKKTSNPAKYLNRLLKFAFLTQPIYLLFHYSVTHQVPGLNVLFLFILSGLILASGYKTQVMIFVLGILSISLFGYGFYIEYSLYGLGVILLIDRYNQLPKTYWWFVWTILHLLTISLNYPLQWLVWFFGFSLPHLQSISAQGIKAYWFYWVYPLHFLVLWAVGTFFGLRTF